MPLKKKVHSSTSATVKDKRKVVLKDSTNTLGQKTKPLVSALKENNRCLATALDESRHEYRLLQDNFLKLQQERQKLLEKVASLENQLVKQDLQLFAIHVQPTLQLLEQAEKDIKCAKYYLKTCLDPAVSSDFCGVPDYFSPIQDYYAKKHGDHTAKRDAISSGAKVASEAEVHTKDEVKAVYPKTPHPGSLKSPQHFSTPLVDSEVVQFPFLVCSPHAISFEDSLQADTVVDKNGGTGTERNPERQLTGPCKVESSPTEGSQAGTKECDADVVVSPGLPEDEDFRAGGDDIPKINDLPSDLSTTDRPRRKCTSFNISYQEPSLNRKLRRGDPFTSENTGFQHSEKAKNKIQRNIPKVARATLKDVTNKK